MSNLTILNSSIRQLDGLFSLNDLHKISGNEDKHLPFRFMRLEQTQELIAEIQSEFKTPDMVFKITKGRGIQGTYACKELVIAYAAWISPQFHLVVLRAFLNQLENSQKNEQIAPLAERGKRQPLIIIRKDDPEFKLLLRLMSHAFEYSKIQEAIREGTNDPNLLPVCQHLLYGNQSEDGFMFSFKANIKQDLQQAEKLIEHLI